MTILDAKISKLALKKAQQMGFSTLDDFVRFLLSNFTQGRVSIDLNNDPQIASLYAKLHAVTENFANEDVVYKTLGKEGAVMVPSDLHAKEYNQLLASTKAYVNDMYEGIITETKEAFFHIHWLQSNNFERNRDSVRYYNDLYALSLVPKKKVAVMSFKQQGYDVALHAAAYPKIQFESVELTPEGVKKSTELLRVLLKLHNTNVRQGDGSELLSSYDDNSLGGVIGNWTLAIASDPLSKLANMYRKLAPNGILVLSESAGTSYPKSLYDQRGILHMWEKRNGQYVLKVYFQDLEKTLMSLGFKIIASSLDDQKVHDTVIAIKSDKLQKRVSITEIMDSKRHLMVETREQLKAKLLE